MNKQEEKPPLFPRWSIWYIVVAAWLIALVIFFYFFTKTFA
ncbi:hypothetical protein [Chitinophaga sp. XS-30]|nr:hypothetical protein [Chitinophaga sp. XS-30]